MARQNNRHDTIAKSTPDKPRADEAVVAPAVVAPVVAAPVADTVSPAPTPERFVRIRNITDQMIQCSVLSESGVREDVRLDARSSSRPYREAAIDDYTHSLVARGYLKIETAR